MTGFRIGQKKLILATAMIFASFLLLACGGGSSGLDGDISELDGDGGTNSLALEWTAPTTNPDGTPLQDLAGYRLYYGYQSGAYSFVADINKAYTQASIGGLSTTTWYFAVTAYDYFGNESRLSNEVSYTF